ncbi:MAG: sulfotransferase domain-containing protein [Paracoccaceae bacterium]
MTHPAKVDFVVAGVQKSGTQALRHFLMAHPGIGLSTEIEPHYFDRDYPRDPPGSYAAYHAKFSPEALGKCTGDITPVYSYLEDCAGRMAAYNPDFKVMLVLRQPADRAYSQYAMEDERGLMKGSFLREVLMEPIYYLRFGQHRWHSLVARGFYARQIERLWRYFPRDRVLVLLHEDLSNDHAATLRRIYRFLGVEQIDPPEPERIHVRSYAPMSRPARWLLRLVYARDTRRLEKMLGRDLSAWRR